jgi:hypothetical protein
MRTVMLQTEVESDESLVAGQESIWYDSITILLMKDLACLVFLCIVLFVAKVMQGLF